MKSLFTGWRTVTPGPCPACGFDDGWTEDGRGNVLCDCTACLDCGIVDAYGMHEPGCPALDCKHEHGTRGGVCEDCGDEV